LRDKPVAEIAKDLGISESCLRNWMSQADINEGLKEGLTSDERTELVRLRRENRVQAMEIEILKRARVDSTGQRNTLDDHGGGVAWRRLAGRGCRRRSGSRSGRCGV
jgi:transposase-like protein